MGYKKGAKRLSRDNSVIVTDEKFNSLSHIFGAIMSLFGGALLIVNASIQGDPFKIIGVSIYTVSLILLFLASGFHHGINGSRKTNNVLRTLDYSAVYLLIAGTFTPICLIMLRNPFGWVCFGVIWALAATGISLRSSIRNFPNRYSSLFYITMGWIGIFIFFAVKEVLSLDALGYFIGGGVAYTIGFVIFVLEKPNLIPGKFCYHEIWHIFVLLGALLHFWFIYKYALLF